MEVKVVGSSQETGLTNELKHLPPPDLICIIQIYCQLKQFADDELAIHACIIVAIIALTATEESFLFVRLYLLEKIIVTVLDAEGEFCDDGEDRLEADVILSGDAMVDKDPHKEGFFGC